MEHSKLSPYLWTPIGNLNPTDERQVMVRGGLGEGEVTEDEFSPCLVRKVQLSPCLVKKEFSCVHVLLRKLET